MAPLDNLAQFVKSNSVTATSASTIALARTFPELLILAPAANDAVVTAEIVAAIPRIKSSTIAGRALDAYIDTMSTHHATQLLATGENRYFILTKLLKLTTTNPNLTSKILERGRWAKNLIEEAYILECTIPNSSDAAHSYTLEAHIPYVVEAMSTEQLGPMQTVERLVESLGSQWNSVTNHALSKLAADPAIFEAAIITTEKRLKVGHALLNLGAIPTVTNRELADELLRTILKTQDVLKVGSVAAILSNPYVANDIVEELKALKGAPVFADAHIRTQVDRPGLNNAFLHSPSDIFNEKGYVQLKEISFTRGFSRESAKAVTWLKGTLDVISSSLAHIILLHELFAELTEMFLAIDGLTVNVAARQHKLIQTLATYLPRSTSLNILSRFELPPSPRPKTMIPIESTVAKMSQCTNANNKAAFKEVVNTLGERIQEWEELYRLMAHNVTATEALNVMNHSNQVPTGQLDK